jgi:hypothetical protein
VEQRKSGGGRGNWSSGAGVPGETTNRTKYFFLFSGNYG